MSEPQKNPQNAPKKQNDNLKLPTRADDFSGWYNELVKRAKLADNSDVRGAMVIRPNGYAIREVGVLVARVLEHAVEHALHVFPDGVAVRANDHRAAHVGVV